MLFDMFNLMYMIDILVFVVKVLDLFFYELIIRKCYLLL